MNKDVVEGVGEEEDLLEGDYAESNHKEKWFKTTRGLGEYLTLTGPVVIKVDTVKQNGQILYRLITQGVK